VWFVSAPFLSRFFATPILPLLITAPVWFFTVITALNSGFLTGAHKFMVLASFLIVEALTKLAMTVMFVYLGMPDLVYLALPISLAVSAVFGTGYVLFLPRHDEDDSLKDESRLP